MNSYYFAIFQNLGAQELILLFLVVLLFFGAKRLPELFRSFGKSVKEFKKATSDIEGDIRTAMDSETTNSKQATQVDDNKTQAAVTADETADNTENNYDNSSPDKNDSARNT